jgi:hypothetical protein
LTHGGPVAWVGSIGSAPCLRPCPVIVVGFMAPFSGGIMLPERGQDARKGRMGSVALLWGLSRGRGAGCLWVMPWLAPRCAALLRCPMPYASLYMLGGIWARLAVCAMERCPCPRGRPIRPSGARLGGQTFRHSAASAPDKGRACRKWLGYFSRRGHRQMASLGLHQHSPLWMHIWASVAAHSKAHRGRQALAGRRRGLFDPSGPKTPLEGCAPPDLRSMYPAYVAWSLASGPRQRRLSQS